MPIVTLTTLKGQRSAEERQKIGDAVYDSLHDIGVPLKARFRKSLELAPEDFYFDRDYPDLETPRSDKFILIEIVVSVGKSAKDKRKMLDALMERLTALGVTGNDVMVVFEENTWESWAHSNGKIFYL